jgi:hypothetical protein
MPAHRAGLATAEQRGLLATIRDEVTNNGKLGIFVLR